MAASHLWQTPAKYTVRLYMFLVWMWEYMQTLIYACYLWSLSSICDGKVCDVYFYDVKRRTVTVLLCNSCPFKIAYLMVMKFIVKANIDTLLEIPFENEHWLSKPGGLYEIIYYREGKWSQTLRRTYYAGDDHSAQRPSGKFLLAMMNTKYTITNLVNDYWTSLTKIHAFTADEFVGFCSLKMNVPMEDHSKVFIICDDTLEEKKFEGKDIIALL